MPAGPRSYSTGTGLALYALANGNCYFPDCPERVVVFVEGHPVNNAQIAHVRGANPGSARYDPAMTDEERRSFKNLILLCKPHHTLVDTVVPDEYPAATLLQWKAAREIASKRIPDALEGLTADGIEAQLRLVMQELAPARVALVEAMIAFQAADGQWISSTAEAAKPLLQANTQSLQRVALMAKIRNAGALPAVVDGITLAFPIVLPDNRTSNIYWQGRNDFPHLHNTLPHSLSSGASMVWLWDTDALWGVIAAAVEGVVVDRYCAEVHLGSGETVRSNEVLAQDVPIIGRSV